jgi:predicted transglutaminase-like cysteine proteinase
LKSTFLAALIALAALAPAAAQALDLPANVTSTAVPARAEQSWKQLSAYIHSLPASHRPGHINLVMNGFRYAADAETTGEEDHWDTPLEFVGRGVGDCEDFAIAKYFMMLEAGVAPELVRLAFVFYSGEAKALGASATRPKRTHVVVLHYQHLGDRDPLVLDAVPHIAPLSEREDLHLVFEFAADGSSRSAVSESVVSSRAIGRMMTKWSEVLDRMRGDGGGHEAQLLALGNRAQPVQVAQSATGPQRAR